MINTNFYRLPNVDDYIKDELWFEIKRGIPMLLGRTASPYFRIIAFIDQYIDEWKIDV